MKLLLSLLFTTLILATSTPKPKAIKFFDNFDNPPKGNPLLPAASAINDTAGGALAYSAFSYSDHSTTAATLAVPSGKYCAGSGVTAQLQQGQRGWKGINSSVSYFDENSIFYACQLYDATGNPSVAITCTIQVTGVKYGTGTTVLQELVYNPGALPVARTFASASFGDNFKNLTRVDVQLADAPVPGTLIVINLDNHAYTAYFRG
ncbi:hypothetical protein G7Y79_00052g087600 [Physcia stellaris]|nr:hypothetical protein G7Y79_00052g087600 [Physcia stellaris]